MQQIYYSTTMRMAAIKKTQKKMNVEKFPPPFLLLGKMVSGAAAIEKGRAVSQIKHRITI